MSENTPSDSQGEDLEDVERIATSYEPNFARTFARGVLVHGDEDDGTNARLSFWSVKDENIDVGEETAATGYRIENEIVMSWDAIRNVRDELNEAIEAHRQDPDVDND